MVEENITLKEFMDFVKSYKEKKDFHYNEVGNCDKALTDLDHELELKSLNGAGMLKYAKERKSVLLKRRENKDQLYILQELEKRFPNMNNISNTISGIIKSSKNLEEQLNNRIYTPRILTDKFDVEKQVEGYKSKKLKTVKTIDELKREYTEPSKVEPTQEEISKNIVDNIKLREVDKSHVIKYRSEKDAKLDLLFDKIKGGQL